jgi:hypothetical protein
MTRVHVANVAQLFDCGQNQASGLGPDFSRVIQDVRHGCGGDRSGFGNVTDSYAHDGKYGQLGGARNRVAVTWRSIDEKKILDNANDSVIFPGTHFR